jgi:hypothetical protein
MISVNALRRRKSDFRVNSWIMAWSFAGRKNGDAHDPRLALEYAAEVELLLAEPSFVQNQLFKWWI